MKELEEKIVGSEVQETRNLESENKFDSEIDINGLEHALDEKIDQLEQNSGLEQQQLSEIKQSLNFDQRLEKLRADFRMAAKKYRYELSKFVRSEDSYKTRSVEMDYRTEQFEQMLKSDLYEAIRFLDESRREGKYIHTKVHIYAEVKNHLDQTIQTKGLEEGVREAARIPDISMQHQWARDLLGKVRSEIASAENKGELKVRYGKIFPALGAELWHDEKLDHRWDSTKQLDFTTNDVAEMAMVASKSGDTETALEIVKKLNRTFQLGTQGTFSTELTQYVEKHSVDALRILIDTNQLREITDFFNLYQFAFRQLSKTEKIDLVEEIYNRHPAQLYNMRDVIQMNETQKKRIIHAWRSEQDNHSLAKSEKAQAVGATEELRQEAIEKYIESDPRNLAKTSAKESIDLSLDQKRRLYEKLFEESQQTSYGNSSKSREALLNNAVISNLDLKKEDLIPVLLNFIQHHSGNNSAYKKEVSGFKPEILIIQAEHKIDMMGYPFPLQEALKFVAKPYPIEVTANLIQIFELNEDWKNYISDAGAARDLILAVDPEKSAMVYEKSPKFFTDVSLNNVYRKYENSEEWAKFSERLEEITKVDDTLLSDGLIELFINNENYKLIPRLLEIIPQAGSHIGLVENIISDPSEMEWKIEYVNNHPDWSDKLLWATINLIGNDQEKTSKITEIAELVPNYLMHWQKHQGGIVEEIVKNYDVLLPMLKACNENPSEVNVLSSDIIAHLRYHPSEVGDFVDLYKNLRAKNLEAQMAVFYSALLKNPEKIDLLAELKEMYPQILDVNMNDSVREVLHNPNLVSVVEFATTNHKDFVLDPTLLNTVSSSPELLKDFLILAEKLTQDTPPKLLDLNLEAIINNPNLTEVIIDYKNHFQDKVWEWKSSQLRYLFENFDNLNPLLDAKDSNPFMVFDMKLLKHMNENPSEIPDYLEFLKKLGPDLYKSFAAEYYPSKIEQFIGKDNKQAELLNIKTKAPTIFKKFNTLEIMLERFDELSSLLDEDLNPEVLFNNSGFKYFDTTENSKEDYLEFVKNFPKDTNPGIITGSLVINSVMHPEILSYLQKFNESQPGLVYTNEILEKWTKNFEEFEPILADVISLPFKISFGDSDLGMLQSENEETREKYFNLVHELSINQFSNNLSTLIAASSLHGLIPENMERDFQSMKDQSGYKSSESNQLYKWLIANDAEVTDQNWARVLNAYLVIVDNEIYGLSATDKERVLNLFGTDQKQNKELCLKKLQSAWENYLQTNGEELPLSIQITLNSIEANEGAGPLRYIESLGFFMNDIRKLETGKEVVKVKPARVFEGLQEMNGRMQSEKWTEDEKAIFYDMSRSIYNIEPRVYTDFLKLFSEKDETGRFLLSPKNLQQFFKENFPLLQAELYVQEDSIKEGNKESLIEMKRRLRRMTRVLGSEEGVDVQTLLSKEKQQTIESIQKGFKERFGLVKVPEEFGEKEMRTLQDFVMYMGNLADRGNNEEQKLSLFLGLILSNEWDNFRQGKDINLGEYFSDENKNELQKYLDKRKELNPVTAENIGLTSEQMPRFNELLQAESDEQIIGNIETIDIKLGNLVRNIERLGDEDLFADIQDKQILALYKDQGDQIGKVLSKIFQRSNNKRHEPFNDAEVEIENRLTEIFKVENWDSNQVKAIQDRTKTFNRLTNILRNVEQSNASDQIKELNDRLQPSARIIDIFKTLGEEFNIESGAVALSQDIAFLRELAAKNVDQMSEEDKELVANYLDGISDQLTVLENTLSKVKTHFTQLRKSTHDDNNALLKTELQNIESIINSKETSTAITSKMTHDMSLIIENMRQCLGCTYEGANNDTNISFGDQNKFYMMAKRTGEVKSIADQIVFFEPTTYDDKQEMSFVMDQIYGSQSSDVLLGNVLATLKKQRRIKNEFPEATISTFVTNAALRSVGLNAELLEKALKAKGVNESMLPVKEASVNVVPSAGSDHYVEFGGGARTKGERKVDGVVIR